ncbi:MAG: hypothetical protein OXC03_02765 [Flavobacteriaceae bacterium]|nr:hypothetical protein [Flavobacteriaceae bacterium]
MIKSIKTHYILLVLSFFFFLSCINLSKKNSVSAWNNLSEEYYSYIVLMIDKYERRNQKVNDLDCYEDLYWDDERMKKAYADTIVLGMPGFSVLNYYDYIIDPYSHNGGRIIDGLNEDDHKKINKIWEKQISIGDSLHSIRQDIVFGTSFNIGILNWYNELLENPTLPLSSALSLSSNAEEIEEELENCHGHKESFVMYSSLQVNETLKELHLLKNHLLSNSNKYDISNFKSLFESYYTYVSTAIDEYTKKKDEWKNEDINCKEVFFKYKYQILNQMDFRYEEPWNSISFRQMTNDMIASENTMDYVEDRHLFLSLDKTLLPIIQDSLSDDEKNLLLQQGFQKEYNHLSYIESFPVFEGIETIDDVYLLDWDCNKTLEIILEEMERKIEEFYLFKNHFDTNQEKYNL